MTEKEMWIIIRRALLMIVAAIEKKYALKNGKLLEPPTDNTSTAYISFAEDK